MIISYSGHRPNKLPGGYNLSHPFYHALKTKLKNAILELNPSLAYCGMAIGFDQLAAEVCIDIKLPFIAAIPFKGQELRWPKSSQQIYHELLKYALKIEICNPGGYAAWKMQNRNRFMVDNSDTLIACWDGSDGGTANCINYAKSIDKKIVLINPEEIEWIVIS